MIDFPSISFEKLWHIGTMERANKKTNSFEGSGLSVSTEPKAWLTIAKLGGNLFFELKKDGNLFLNFYEMTDELRKSIMRWGLSQNLIQHEVLYRVSWYDDESKSTRYIETTDKREAEREKEDKEVVYQEEAKIEIMDGYVSTVKLQNRTLSVAPPLLVFSLLTTVFVEDYLHIDGVWWEEQLDVSNYSAPRGVIVPKKVSEWTCRKVENLF